MLIAGLITHWSIGFKILFWIVFWTLWGLFTWKIYIPFAKWYVKDKRRVLGLFIFFFLNSIVLLIRSESTFWTILSIFNVVIFGSVLIILAVLKIRRSN